ncbi:Hypothetical_protein [Hexamita inflata]|uniref:Hypothetical_protein n=1 Tax=Hexamita inflata TaxID=28002 RepID=A0ABP1J6I5_9EUKA
MHKLSRNTLIMSAKDIRNIMIVGRPPKRRKLKISLNHQTPTMISISHTMRLFKELCLTMKCLTKLQRLSLQIKIINIPSNRCEQPLPYLLANDIKTQGPHYLLLSCGSGFM